MLLEEKSTVWQQWMFLFVSQFKAYGSLKTTVISKVKYHMGTWVGGQKRAKMVKYYLNLIDNDFEVTYV